jgi:1-deoxy-D-xylulose-5-phosphate reductoisomerase
VALARKVGMTGGTAPAVYNAANEEAVTAFLDGYLKFTGIVDTVSAVVAQSADQHDRGKIGNPLTVADVLSAESDARALAHAFIEKVGATA